MKTKSGFTLIEMLVVVSILAILAIMGTGNYITSLKRGRDARRRADLHAVQNCMEQYRSVMNQYEAVAVVSNAITVNCDNPANNKKISVKDPLNTSPFVYMGSGIASGYSFSANFEIDPANTITVTNQQ